MEYFPELMQCELFKNHSYEEIEDLLTCVGAYTKDFSRGEYIAQPNEKMTELAILLDGTAKVYRGDNVHRDSVAGLLKSLDSFGAAYVITSTPLIVSVIAVTSCKVLFIPFEKLVSPCEKTCNIHLRATRNMLDVLSKKVLNHGRRASFIYRHSIRAKLSAFLLDLYHSANEQDFILPFSRTHLAEYLDVSRSSMVRELTAMKNEGLISFEGNRFYAVDKEALQNCAYE